MTNRPIADTARQILPCVGFSMLAGFVSAVIITLFKLCAEAGIRLSANIYGAVRSDPVWLPLLVLGAAVIGFGASLLYGLSRSCRGGGIPSSVAAIRGILSFRWWACLVILPISALMSFLCGMPLGTEGPCVQLGTSIGDGVIQCCASKKQKGWRRYIMTGGASAGFSIAASSPLTAIIFAMEELHNHFSPLLMTVASVSVITAQATVQALSRLGVGSVGLFHITEMELIDAKMLFIPVVIGIACGIGSMLFTRLYQQVNRLMRYLIGKVSVKILFPILFACICIIGFLLADSLGTGHSLTDVLLENGRVWYMIILVFLIRALTMMISNTAGVTGGIFLPTICFGALIGALCGKAMLALGIIGEEHFILAVVLGIASFLGATSHIPVTACIFAVETLGCFSNALSVMIAVTLAYMTVELFGIEDFTETVINAKIESAKDGKSATVVDVPLTVNEGAFVIGKEMRDILWPSSCFVVSIKRSDAPRHHHQIAVGDVITLHYKTYNPYATATELKVLMGEQSAETRSLMIPKS